MEMESMSNKTAVALKEAMRLCEWIEQHPHERGSINTQASAVANMIRALQARPQRPVLWVHRDNPALTTTREPLSPDWIPLVEAQ
jgi:hypothetical protein